MYSRPGVPQDWTPCKRLCTPSSTRTRAGGCDAGGRIIEKEKNDFADVMYVRTSYVVYHHHQDCKRRKMNNNRKKKCPHCSHASSVLVWVYRAKDGSSDRDVCRIVFPCSKWKWIIESLHACRRMTIIEFALQKRVAWTQHYVSYFFVLLSD